MEDNKLALINDRGQIKGMEGLDRSDITLPRFQANCKSGVFINSLSKEETREINAILLSVRKGYVCWEEGKTKPVCRSNDRITGVDSDREIQSCVECKKCQWGDNGEKPTCKATYEFLLLGDKQTVPYALTVKGASLKPAKNYMTYFVVNRIPLFSCKTQIIMEQKSGDNGPYYIVTFSRLGDIEQAELFELAKQMEIYRNKEVTELEAEPVEEGPDRNKENLPF